MFQRFLSAIRQFFTDVRRPARERRFVRLELFGLEERATPAVGVLGAFDAPTIVVVRDFAPSPALIEAPPKLIVRIDFLGSTESPPVDLKPEWEDWHVRTDEADMLFAKVAKVEEAPPQAPGMVDITAELALLTEAELELLLAECAG